MSLDKSFLLKQRLSSKIHKVIYSELSSMGIEYIEHGESFIIGRDEFEGLKVEIKVTVK